ncbi:MAG: tetratricopeptide repeat protein, partial [Planctomycetota bacterium]
VAAYHDTLARGYLALGQREAAREAFERALRLDANHLDALLGLAVTLIDDDQRDRAARLYARLEPVFRTTDEPAPHLRAEFRKVADTFGTARP